MQQNVPLPDENQLRAARVCVDGKWYNGNGWTILVPHNGYSGRTVFTTAALTSRLQGNGNQLWVDGQLTLNYHTVAVSFNDVSASATNNWTNYPAGYGVTSTTNRNGCPADAQMNISANPLFVSATNFHLTAHSPCVNAGSSTGAPTTDIDGQRRGPYVDIGCDEYFIPPLFVSSAPSSGHKFGGTVVGEVGIKIAIEATTNLVDWTSIATLTNLTGSCSFIDNATNFSRRFYRGKELP
jgi:hypothetical protein